MLRKKRKGETWGAFLREWVWPSLGWKRWSLYMRHRIGRMPGGAHHVACGLACGAAVSVTPFLGFHIISSVLLAWLLRGNLVAAALGTLLGNPWTFPFIWVGTFWLGHALMGTSAPPVALPTSLAYLFTHFGDLLWPSALGGFVLMPVVWFVFYVPVRGLVKLYQKKRPSRLTKE